jgi:antitoxin CptB
MGGELGRLRWRCRRGMKELDLLLCGYLDAEYEEADPDRKDAFSRLLDCPDPLIYDYFLGRALPPDPALTALIRQITIRRSNRR